MEDLLNDLFILKPNSVLFKSIDGIHQKTTTQYSLIEIGEEVGSGTESFEEKRRIFINTILIRECDQDRLEIKTRGQSGNPSWFEFRKGRLTASLHHEIVTKMKSVLRKKSNPKPVSTTRLLEKIITRDTFFDCAAMKWGRDHEKEALDAFHASESEIHEAMSLHESGLLVSKNGYVAASPDAVMTCACHGKFAVEVKCPFSLKDDTVTNNKLISTKCDSLLWDADQERVTLKLKHKYRTQINSQMALLGVKQGYFIVWTRKSV